MPTSFTSYRMPFLAVVLIGVAVLTGIFVGQLSAHDGVPKTVHACVKDASGEVKVVGPGEGCKKNWTALDWPAGDGIRAIASVDGFNQQQNFTARKLAFVKRLSDTGVRVVWTDNRRCFGNGNGCRWEVLFDGASCDDPGPLAFDYFVGHASVGGGLNFHRSETLIGTCFGLAAGSYEIGISVGAVPGKPAGSPLTGWQGYWSLEAEEVR